MSSDTATVPQATTPPSARRPLSSNRARGGSDLRVALVFLLPAAVGFGVFFLWPAARGLYYSFTDYNIFAPPRFVGLDNYRRLLGDDLFWNALLVTAQYVAVNIGVQTVVALGIAVLLHRLTKSMTVRGILLMPYLVANVVVALVWFWILDYQIGIANQMLDWVGLDRIAFFGDSAWAMSTIALVNVWRHVGYTALLLFAGMQTIPTTIYEAAAIDGASEWQMFWRITMPLLRPVFALVLVLTVIGSFQVFDTIAVTTEGGPVNATRVIYYYIFDLAFQRSDFGYGSAMSVALFVLLAGVAFVQLKMLRANKSDLS